MKKINKKRGFTIIELVIVIAVIAILSAVLIPTFAGIIKKAKQSTDEQAVRQMNTALAGSLLDDDATIYDVYEALEGNGIDADNYKPLYKDRLFFYDTVKKQVVYTDASYTVLYPEHLVNNSDRANWITLSGEIAKADINDITINGTAATVESAEEFVTLMQSISAGTDNKTKDVRDITLTAGTTYNLMGADISIKKIENKNTASNGVDFAINGNGATLAGVVNGTPVREATSQSGAERRYAAGLVGTVSSTAYVTISNVTIENAVFGDKNVSLVGLVGTAHGKVVFDNVTVKNSTFVGQQKVGAFVGYLDNKKSDVTIKSNCVMENVTVEATQGMAGGVFGILQKGKVTVEDFTNIDVDVKLQKISSGHYIDYVRTETDLLDTTIALDMNDDFTLNLEEKTVDSVTGYRYFATCARYGFIYNANTAPAGLVGYNNKPVIFAYGATAATLPTLTENVGYVWTKGI